MKRIIYKALAAWRYYMLRPQDYKESMEREFTNNLYSLQFMGLWFSVFSLVMAVLFATGLVTSTHPAYSTTTVYALVSIVSAVFAYYARKKHNEHKSERNASKKLIYALIIIVYSLFMLTGLYTSVYTNYDSYAVLFFVFLIGTSVLIFTSPMLNLALVLGASVAFAITGALHKDHLLWITDMQNLTATFFMAASFAWFAGRHRILKAFSEIQADTINQAAQILLASGDDIQETIVRGMELIGRRVGVDRVNLWVNEVRDGEIYYVLRHCWISAELNSNAEFYVGLALPFSDRPKWYERLSAGERLNSPVRELTPESAAYLGSYDVKSVAILPLIVNDELYGSLSIDDCDRARRFTSEEMEIFASTGLMFAHAIIRSESEEKTKMAQIAEESNIAKSRFLARMSHELRTPITAVLGVSEIQLRTRNLPSEVGGAFGKINDSAQQLLSIVNDILDFSKIEAGKLPIIDKEYTVAQLVSDAAQFHAIFLENSKDINFEVQVDEEMPARMIGDMLRVRQVIDNLVSNSFKYTDCGTITLSFEYEQNKGGEAVLRITVDDTGIGMNESQLRVLKTSEYTRFREQDERFVSGTGLGIPIVYSLVQKMNGTVDFESEVGRGTKAIVSIPQKACGAEALGKEMAQRLQNYRSYTKEGVNRVGFVPEPMPYGKVLVVDDVESNLFVARGLLDFYKIDVETCNSGQSAIDKIEQGNVYDIVFMDYLMPGLNGIETMRIMREKGYSQPIVVLTANAVVGQAEEFMKSGFDDFISKPIQTKNLDEILTKFIRDKQPEQVIAEARASAEQKTNENGIDSFLKSDEVVNTLRVDFVRSHKKSLSKITEALDTGDTETAYRLAHTIKGAAGLIFEDELVEIAENAENLLRKGEVPTKSCLYALESELSKVLASVAMPELSMPSGEKPFDRDKILASLDALEPLLELQDAGCLKHLSELRHIPQAAVLLWQIEAFQFDSALISLKTLREVIS